MERKTGDFGWPMSLGTAHHKPRKLKPGDREAIISEFVRLSEENKDLVLADYARQVCGQYGISAAYVRQIIDQWMN
jgi:hypothetical protein